MKFCMQCGNQLGDNDAFCNKCGCPAPAAQPAPAPVAEPAPAPVPVQPEFVQPEVAQPQPMQQPVYEQQFVQPGPAAAPQQKSGGISIAAFILSFLVAPVGLILGIVAAATKAGKKGLAIAAIIIGAITTIGVTSIIAGVAGPQFVKYNEKSKVSQDTQLCDTLKTAITTAMMDPSVITSANSGIPTNSNWQAVRTIDTNTAFGQAVTEMMGFSPADVESHIKSSYGSGKANGVQFKIEGGNHVSVRIEHSDRTGNKGRRSGSPIEVF